MLHILSSVYNCRIVYFPSTATHMKLCSVLEKFNNAIDDPSIKSDRSSESRLEIAAKLVAAAKNIDKKTAFKALEGALKESKSYLNQEVGEKVFNYGMECLKNKESAGESNVDAGSLVTKMHENCSKFQGDDKNMRYNI